MKKHQHFGLCFQMEVRGIWTLGRCFGHWQMPAEALSVIKVYHLPFVGVYEADFSFLSIIPDLITIYCSILTK